MSYCLWCEAEILHCTVRINCSLLYLRLYAKCVSKLGSEALSSDIHVFIYIFLITQYTWLKIHDTCAYAGTTLLAFEVLHASDIIFEKCLCSKWQNTLYFRLIKTNEQTSQFVKLYQTQYFLHACQPKRNRHTLLRSVSMEVSQWHNIMTSCWHDVVSDLMSILSQLCYLCSVWRRQYWFPATSMLLITYYIMLQWANHQPFTVRHLSSQYECILIEMPTPLKGSHHSGWVYLLMIF